MNPTFVRPTVRARRRYQTLSTTIADDRSGVDAGFQVYPSDPLDVPPSPDDYPPAARSLTPLLRDLDWRVEAYPVKSQEDTLAFALSNSLMLDAEALESAAVPPEVLDFAFYLVREPVLPFRHSPIEGKALAELLAARGRSPGTATGAFVGVLAGGASPLLFLTVPGGMILGGAAWGVATALERGLHEKVLRWLGIAD